MRVRSDMTLQGKTAIVHRAGIGGRTTSAFFITTW